MNAPLISLIGMDGSGKTTLTTRLKTELEKQNIKTALIYTGRGRNNILPIQFFGKLYFKLKGESKETPEEKLERLKDKLSTKEKKIKLLHTLAAPIFALDLFLRYLLVIRPARKKNKIVLTDRYSSDILLMKHVPDALRQFLYLFFPKPTQTIYLYNTPEKLFARKEHPLEDLRRQEKLFEKINQKIRPVEILAEDQDKTFNEAMQIVQTILEKK